MLHLVFAGSSTADLLAGSLAALAPGDAMLLLDSELVELLLSDSGLRKELEAYAADGCRFMTLAEHTTKAQGALPACIEVLHYDDFVRLVTEHEQNRSWF